VPTIATTREATKALTRNFKLCRQNEDANLALLHLERRQTRKQGFVNLVPGLIGSQKGTEDARTAD
jgi:hypothetical protein